MEQPTTHGASLIFVDGPTLERVAEFPSLVEALRQAHTRRMHCDESMHLSRTQPDGTRNAFNLLPAWQEDEVLGAKLVTYFPGNLDKGLPSAQGIFALFNAATGTPSAIIDGTALTLWKTSADSALGSSLLSRPDSRCLLVVGAGGLSFHAVAAHLAVRPALERVLIWNRSPTRATALRDRLLHTDLGQGRTIRVVSDLEKATAEADIITCLTMSETPLIQGAWVKNGTHVDLIGGWTPQMREVDGPLIARARVFGNERNRILECGDLLAPLRAGDITAEHILGDLFDLCTGLPGRNTTQDITVYKNAGGGHLDLFTARYILARMTLA
ncbi:MAG: ornithine cyclodeaminase family protein [Acetobacter sp.]|uniref:hypothetical protein n=1 Tax=Acetobacter sp. TaxID=440 RepID=UPI0039E97F0D